MPLEPLKGFSSRKLLSLWLEYEQHTERERRLGLLQKLSILFRFKRPHWSCSSSGQSW